MKNKDEQKQPSDTRGSDKMKHYLDNLIRNTHFQKALKRLRRNATHFPDGHYESWTAEQQQEHDQFNKEIGAIIKDYEVLRKRCEKILRNKHFRATEKIAYDYNLDFSLISEVEAISGSDDFFRTHPKPWYDEIDMCRIIDIYDDELNPANPGEEIIHLNPKDQLQWIAYPIAIIVHSKAAKRDVLDFIEKRWARIEMLLRDIEENKALRIGRRKYSRKMIDFIWQHQTSPAKQIKSLLDEQFPNESKPVYYEISSILRYERIKRNQKINVGR